MKLSKLRCYYLDVEVKVNFFFLAKVRLLLVGGVKVQVGDMSLRGKVPSCIKDWGPKLAASPSIVVGKLDRDGSQEVRHCTGQEETSSSKTGPVSVRCDRATANGQLTVKSESPRSLWRRLLEMVVHLLMSPGVGEGYRALKGPTVRQRHWDN